MPEAFLQDGPVSPEKGDPKFHYEVSYDWINNKIFIKWVCTIVSLLLFPILFDASAIAFNYPPTLAGRTC